MITRLCGGTLVLSDGCKASDLWIEGEKILSIGDGPGRADREIDATGCYVLPGSIDAHVHMGFEVGEFTSTDTFSSGSRAAAFGGVTTLIDFAVPQANETTEQAAIRRIEQARGACDVDFGIHAVITRVTDDLVQQLERCLKIGIPDFKAFTTYVGLRLSSADLCKVMTCVREARGLVMVHAEHDGDIQSRMKQLVDTGQLQPLSHYKSRPAEVEVAAVKDVLRLQAETDCPIHFVHISSSESVDWIRDARERGRDVSGETCPHYLVLTCGVYEGSEGGMFMVSPPIKTESDRRGLWTGLEKGDLETIATDHCPFSRDQKRKYTDFRRIPTGLPGIETTLAVMFSEWQLRGWPLEHLVDRLSTNVAKRFGLYPRKGTLQPGSDADAVIYDPRGASTLAADTLHMNVDWSPFEGQSVIGCVRDVLLRGRPLIERRSWVGGKQAGQYLPRVPISTDDDTGKQTGIGKPNAEGGTDV